MVDLANSNIISKMKDRSTRIVSAYAYQSGILGGISAISMLNIIRRSPLTALSPEIGIDVNKVSYHLAQAVVFGLLITLTCFALIFLSFLFETVNLSSISFFLYAISLIIAAAESTILLWWFQIKNFKPDNYKPEFALPLSKRLINYFQKTGYTSKLDQNVIVFGGYSPFIGAGEKISDWQFVVDLSKTSEGHDERIDISIEDLYERVNIALRKRELPRLEEYEHLYVDGKNIGLNSPILPSIDRRPLHHLDSEILKNTKLNTPVGADSRFYKVYRYKDDKHDTTTSAFLQLRKYGQNLYVEASFFALFPVNETIFNIDSREESNLFFRFLYFLLFLLVFIIPFPFLIAYRAYYILKRLNQWRNNDNMQRKILKKCTAGCNYGVIKTFRELIAYDFYPAYFVAKDVKAYNLVFNEVFFETILDELENKGIDISSLREKANSINQGIIINGGSLNADQVAVGKGSQNTFSSMKAQGKKFVKAALN